LKLWAQTITPPPLEEQRTPVNDRTGAGKLSAAIEKRLLSEKGDASLSI
jgi:hypothetical protein